jgi:hypothetical protein
MQDGVLDILFLGGTVLVDGWLIPCIPKVFDRHVEEDGISTNTRRSILYT